MGALFVLPIFLLSALSLSLLSKFKTIESLFISLCSIIFLSTVLTPVFSLSISVYTICILILVLFITSSAYSLFINKNFVEKIKDFFSSPTLLVLVLVTLLYAIQVQGIKVKLFDDMSHWSIAPKAILKYNGLNIPNKILSVNQTYTLPIYHSFIIFFTGFNQAAMLTAKWFFCWTTLLLPFAHYDYKNIKKVLLYTLIMFSLIISMQTTYYMNLYSDLFVLSLFSATIAYYYINKNNKYKDVIILSTMLILPSMKSRVGIIVSIFILSIILFDKLYYSHCKLKKKDFAFFGISLFFIIINEAITRYIISLISKPDPSFIPYNNVINLSYGTPGWNNLLDVIKSVLLSPIGIGFVLLIIIISILFALALFKKSNNFRYYGLGVLLLGAVFIRYTYNMLDKGSIELISVYINRLTTLQFMNVYSPFALGIIISISAAYYIYMLDNKYIKYFLILLGIIIAQGFVIVCITLVKYAMLTDISYIKNSVALNRYIGIIVYFVIFLIPMYFLGMPKLWNKYDNKIKKFLVFLTIIFTLFGLTPGLLRIYYMKYNETYYTDRYFTQYQQCSDLLVECTTPEDKVCLIGDATEFVSTKEYNKIYLGYYTLIPENYNVWLSADEKIDEQSDSLYNFLKDNNFTKVLYVKYNDDIEIAFENFFSDTSYEGNAILYNIVWENDKIFLKNACQ